MNLMFTGNHLQQTYRLTHILLYSLTQLPRYSKDLLPELPNLFQKIFEGGNRIPN